MTMPIAPAFSPVARGAFEAGQLLGQQRLEVAEVDGLDARPGRGVLTAEHLHRLREIRRLLGRLSARLRGLRAFVGCLSRRGSPPAPPARAPARAATAAEAEVPSCNRAPSTTAAIATPVSLRVIRLLLASPSGADEAITFALAPERRPERRLMSRCERRHVRRVTHGRRAVRNSDKACPGADSDRPRSAARPPPRSSCCRVVLALQLSSVPSTANPGTRHLQWVRRHHTSVAFTPLSPLQARTFIPR